MSADWSRVRGAFEELLDLSSEARAPRLAALRLEDPELATEVATLLDAAAASEGQLEPPSKIDVEERLHGRPPLEPGDRIGAYRITRRIATGGMGSVYAAEQDQPQRRVAIKVVHRGLNDDRTLRRFRIEAELLARLQHPFIARIFESGVHVAKTASGSRPWPFYAMEYVPDALPLDRFAAERKLDDEAKLRLFLGFCEAVHFGHQRGVIHRDLKPDNLLVDGDGAPKVIDFGVARVTGDDATTLLTQTGQVVGTLKYMSPEQVEANSEAHDVRTDVYALGVVLFELLTGELPHPVDDRPPLAVARAIRDEAPQRPSLLNPALAVDLEAVLLMALEKDPNRRYPSVAALARDIERFLTHHPVEARGVSWSYHLRLFARRHRVLVTAAATILVVALGATWISLTYAAQSNASRRVADAARLDAEEAQRLAVFERDRARAAGDAERDARERADRLLAQSLEYTATFTTDFPSRLATLPGGTELARELLSGAIGQLERLDENDSPHPAMQDVLARAYFSLADVLGHPFQPNLGDRAGAIANYRRGLALTAPLIASGHANARVRYVAALGSGKLGDLASDAGDFAIAIEHYRESLAGFRALQAEVPGDLDVQGRIPHTLSDLAIALDKIGQAEEAAAILRDLPAQMEALVALDPTNELRRIHVVQALHLAAAQSIAGGDPEAALETYDRARAYLEQFLGELRDDVRVLHVDAWNLQMAGMVRASLADFDEAQSYLDAARRRYETLVERAPNLPDYEVSLNDLYYSLGDLAWKRAEALRLPERGAYLDAARDWFERSRAGFADLERRGRLPGKLADYGERIAAALTGIEASASGPE